MTKLETSLDKKLETLNLIKFALMIIKDSKRLDNRDIILFEIMDANTKLGSSMSLAIKDIDELSAVIVSVMCCYADMNETSFEMTKKKLLEKWENEPIKTAPVMCAGSEDEY